MPIDWTSLAGVIMGTLVVLIPVTGLTVRFAMKPLLEAKTKLIQAQAGGPSAALLEERVAQLEAQLESMETTLHRVLDEQEFHRRLTAAAPDETPRQASALRGA
ncbi:MAG TPA: hypothetical protein VF746_27870 [Longimicrobium sp.]|jgi:hypothetical protein